jgi:hypothetical protein
MAHSVGRAATALGLVLAFAAAVLAGDYAKALQSMADARKAYADRIWERVEYHNQYVQRELQGLAPDKKNPVTKDMVELRKLAAARDDSENTQTVINVRNELASLREKLEADQLNQSSGLGTESSVQRIEDAIKTDANNAHPEVPAGTRAEVAARVGWLKKISARIDTGQKIEATAATMALIEDKNTGDADYVARKLPEVLAILDPLPKDDARVKAAWARIARDKAALGKGGDEKLLASFEGKLGSVCEVFWSDSIKALTDGDVVKLKPYECLRDFDAWKGKRIHLSGQANLLGIDHADAGSFELTCRRDGFPVGFVFDQGLLEALKKVQAASGLKMERHPALIEDLIGVIEKPCTVDEQAFTGGKLAKTGVSLEGIVVRITSYKCAPFAFYEGRGTNLDRVAGATAVEVTVKGSAGPVGAEK